MIPTWISLSVLVGLAVIRIGCADYIPPQLCATFYAEKSSKKSQTFTLNDFERTVELKKEYRYSVQGWLQTGLVEIEEDCTMRVCSAPFFQGMCFTLANTNQTFDFKINSGTFRSVAGIQSASCTCPRICSCKDVFIPKDFSPNATFGRGYVDGCNKCDSRYVKLRASDPSPVWRNDTIEAIVLRTGCTLTIYAKEGFKGLKTDYTMPFFQGGFTINSYSISCNDDPVVPPPPPLKLAYYPANIKLPSSMTAFKQMLAADVSLTIHPGFQAAMRSMQSGRSSRIAYAVIIGSHEAFENGFPQCQNGKPDRIGECRIPVVVKELGVTAELIIITVPIAYTNAPKASYKLMADLAEYLHTRQEYRNTIPNAIIFHHELSNKDVSGNSAFHLKLLALHTMRKRLIDDDYLNVAFLLSTLNTPYADRRFTGGYGLIWERKLNDYGKFAKPFVFLSKADAMTQKYYINGYAIMDNQDLWTKNLQTSIDTICDKNGDPLGRAIFKAVFRDNQRPLYSIKQTIFEYTEDNKWLWFMNATLDSPDFDFSAYKTKRPREILLAIGPPYKWTIKPKLGRKELEFSYLSGREKRPTSGSGSTSGSGPTSGSGSTSGSGPTYGSGPSSGSGLTYGSGPTSGSGPSSGSGLTYGSGPTSGSGPIPKTTGRRKL